MDTSADKVIHFPVIFFLSLFLSACDLEIMHIDEGEQGPVISGTPSTTINKNMTYTFAPGTSGFQGGTLTFAIRNQPSWSAFDTATGILTGTPTHSNVGITNNIVISVSDSKSSASLPAFSIEVVNVNNPPAFGTPNPANLVVVNSSYNYNPEVVDADGDTVSYTITNKPAWAQFSTSTGALTGTPSEYDAGTTNGVIITASDGLSSTSLTAFNITVVNLSSSLNIYVDQLIATNCNTYNVKSRSCQGGNLSAYNTLASGLAATTPGKTLLLRAGSYGQLSPPRSGLQGRPITIMGYPGESASISNLTEAVAIRIINRTDLIIDNLVVGNVQGFARIQDSTRITIQNTTFNNSRTSGTTSAVKFVRSTFSQLKNNTIHRGGGDSFILQDSSNYNLITGNSFTYAGHSIFSIRCSSYNVLRSNTFSNQRQKIGEIYDCEGVSDAPIVDDATRRNLIENNKFTLTRGSSRDYRYNAIQHGGQLTIVRRNVFSNNAGGGVNYQQYSNESMYVYGNRLYNNTFYNNRCYAIIGNIPHNASIYYDNIASNNLLYKNVDCQGSDDQTNIRQSYDVILKDNAITKTDPLFVDEANLDLRLKPSSPHIDTGKPLTNTVGNGTGTTLRVNDASFFYDGFGIASEVGDVIQLENQSVTATITSIDYPNNVISLDKALTWTNGQGVSLRFNGAAPDVGAYETQ